MRSANCIHQLCAKIVIQPVDEHEQIILTVFQDVLNAVFQNNVHSTLSESEVAEKLLLLQEISVTYKSETQIVTKMELR